VVAAEDAESVTVSVDHGQAPAGTDGFTVHLLGAADDGTPVHAVGSFEFAWRSWDQRVPSGIDFTRPAFADTVEELAGLVPWSVDNTGPVDEARAWAVGAGLRGLARIDTVTGVGEQSATNVAHAGFDLARLEHHLPEAAAVVATGPPAVGREGDAIAAAVLGGSLADGVDLERPWTGPFLDRVRPQAGTPCDPDDLPDEVTEDFACQFTGRVEQRWIPGRIVNARKGDIVLSPGGTGLIGGLLKQVSPAQRYSHALIMTRNYYEVSHATGSMSWLRDHSVGSIAGRPAPTDGFDPASLKYVWPGGITQTAEEAYRSGKFTAPDGKTYDLTGFGLEDAATFDGRWEIIPALVIKPHPSRETPQVRATLRDVANQVRSWCVTAADTAQGRQSRLHYRFFCYTDAGISRRVDPASSRVVGQAPEGTAWPANTLPAVCSSVVWLAAKETGLHLEGAGTNTVLADLEPTDLLKGASVDTATADGLYYYDKAERLTAAQWLHGKLKESVEQGVVEEVGNAAGGVALAISDMADDCANQVCNTFAADWSDAGSKDSTKWRDDVGPGRAVSPDDLLLWDEPGAVTGMWGYAVPLIYRSGRFADVPVHEWKQTDGPGTITGVVRLAGAPVDGAEVSLGGATTFTGPDGRFSTQVPSGRYSLYASAQQTIGLCEVRQDVTVEFNQTVDLTLDLQEPPDLYRELVIDGTVDINDDESGDDEYLHEGVHFGPVQVGPYGTHAAFGYERGWGGEIRANVAFTVDWQPDRSIVVNLHGKFYEGTSETTDDLDGSGTATWRIGPDETQVREFYMSNTEEDDPDWIRLSLRLTNRRVG
ncbi:MAG: carboxypeptidase-like regulatory domain-containing protein, partial [Phycicoccus sp.]